MLNESFDVTFPFGNNGRLCVSKLQTDIYVKKIKIAWKKIPPNLPIILCMKEGLSFFLAIILQQKSIAVTVCIIREKLLYAL